MHAGMYAHVSMYKFDLFYINKGMIVMCVCIQLYVLCVCIYVITFVYICMHERMYVCMSLYV